MSQRDFITGVLRDMEGNAVLLLSSGRTDPTDDAPFGKLKVDIATWFRYPAELDEMVAFAEQARSDHRDAYLSPLIYGDAPFIDSKGRVIPRDRDGRPLYTRSKANALFSQTVYMDSDSCPPEAFRLPPSRHVQTSEGHGHDYWFLPEPVPAALASEVAHKITTAHKADGSDPSGWSANKVLRLPTWNTTYDELSPWEVTWEDDDVDPVSGEVGMPKVYDIDTMQDVYADIRLDLIPQSDAPLPPVPDLEGLPGFEELARRIPQTEKRLNDLLYKAPKLGPDGWRSEQRWALLLDLKRFGFTDEETIAIAWHSPAASKWRESARGVAGLWWELQVRAKPLLAAESADVVEVAPEMKLTVRTDRRTEAPKLLSPAARERVQSRSDLVTLYMAYARTKVRAFNQPYHVSWAWIICSLGLSEAAAIDFDPKPLTLNTYHIVIGNSSTGKDESKDVANPIIRQLYPTDAPDVPANSSREQLIENLIARDGKVTYIHDNEADGLLAQMKAGGYSGGIFQYWTRAYDGDVPSLGRVGRTELNKPMAKALTTMQLMGTPAGMLKVLDREMFYTGYLARQIWTIGEDNPSTRDLMKKKRRSGGERAYDGIPKYLGSVFANLRGRLQKDTPLDQKQALLVPTDEALDLHADTVWKITEHFGKEHDIELWKPVIRRMSDIIFKIAGLTAAMNGRTVIGTFDVEVALFYVETWIGNVIQLSEEISDTYFSRQCDDIEKYIASRESHRAEIGAIYRLRKGEEKRVTDSYIQSLEFQGRVEKWSGPEAGSPIYYRIREGRAIS